MVDTSEYKAKNASGWNLCFSNAAVDNPWRQVGWNTMQHEVKLHDEIANFKAVDAEASDDKQISDIEELANGNCDALIVSPNTTKTLTPAVEAACEKVPVIVFDRGVDTDCPVTFVHPIGGYAFGVDGAEFLKENVDVGRQDPGPPDPPRRGRAGDPLVGREGPVRRLRPERRRRRVHRR